MLLRNVIWSSTVCHTAVENFDLLHALSQPQIVQFSDLIVRCLKSIEKTMLFTMRWAVLKLTHR